MLAQTLCYLFRSATVHSKVVGRFTPVQAHVRRKSMSICPRKHRIKMVFRRGSELSVAGLCPILLRDQSGILPVSVSCAV